MPSTYIPIATTTLGSAASSVTFSSISGSYTDLVAIVSANADSAGAAITLRFNSDSGTNYSQTYLYGSGSAASSGRGSNGTEMNIGNTDQTNNQSTIINIQNYSNATTYKTAISKGGGATIGAITYVGLWRSTAAINAVRIGVNTGNFNSGSTFTLYGVKSA